MILAAAFITVWFSDELPRARAAFRNFTPLQMQEPHGQSGETRAQILADYELHEARIQASIDWVKAQGE